MTVQNDQVASVLTRAIQAVLSKGLNDPRVRGMLSVTDVRVSPDMGDATVMISVLPEEHADLTMHGLRHASKHIRTAVGRQVRLRRMPRLSFKLDRSIKRESAVLAAITTAQENDARREAERRTVVEPPEEPVS